MPLPEVPDHYDFRGAANTRPIIEEDKELLKYLHKEEESAINQQAQLMTKEGKVGLSEIPRFVFNLIETYSLPVLFTDYALKAVAAFAKNKEEAAILLMDCLTTFERETVTVDKLMRLYIFGFYDEALVKKILVGTVYTKKHPWHFIYPT